jgi:uncharacterized protein
MKANALKCMLLLLLAGSAPHLLAQQNVTDRQRYEAIKASADHGDVEAQLRLASLYATGEGVARDPKKAAAWHRKAAEQGSARGQCLLGLDYADGLGVKKDLAEAVRWLRKAADQGLAGAQYDLGLIYANGDIQGRSAADAVPLYRKAAEKGLAEAQCVLGHCYLEGAGAPKDIPEGVKWTQKAAEQGNASAQRTLGICYSKGKGVPKDNVQAYKWLNLAASQDNPNTDDTKVNLSMVERFMTPEQIAEGQRLAREFKPAAPPAPGETSTAAGDTNAPAPGATAPAGSANTGLVNVKADDDSQEVFVDGGFVGNAPAKLKLVEGSHVIEVKKAGFKDYRKEIKISEGSELTLKVILEKQ